MTAPEASLGVRWDTSMMLLESQDGKAAKGKTGHVLAMPFWHQKAV